METTTTIRPDVLEQVKASSKAKNRLAYEFDVHSATITRWIESGDIMLTTAKAVRIISEELNLNATEILTEA